MQKRILGKTSIQASVPCAANFHWMMPQSRKMQKTRISGRKKRGRMKASVPCAANVHWTIAAAVAGGSQLNLQLEFPEAVIIKEAPIKLPWRAWRLHSESLGAMEADKASAVAALHNLHEKYDVSSEPIECWQLEKVNCVVATKKVEANAIWLPPCVPKQSKVLERTEHPYAVKLTEK